MNEIGSEPQAVAERYRKRKLNVDSRRYHPLNPAAYMGMQELERAWIRWVRIAGIEPLEEKRVLEVGCGEGGNLLQFIRLGFRPENLVGIELLPERALAARARLPSSISVLSGDAMQSDLPEASFDVVLQATVFSSLLDDAFQEKLSQRMWMWLRPGGGVLWYDFTYNNPRNPDVRGVPIKRIRQLFPKGDMKSWRLTLAPPISRVVVRIHPRLYDLINVLPLLRTHLLCWIEKT